MSELPASRQPDAKPIAADAGLPSLWIYVCILIAAVALIGGAFSLQANPDWPGLMLNVAAGLMASVVVLVFVDRKLRSQEIAAARRLPARTKQRLYAFVFPRERAAFHYVRRLLISLEPLVATKIQLAQYDELEIEARAGFLLRGDAGTGKTTWTQIAAASLARKYLSSEGEGRVPIIFPIAQWLPARTLIEALLETFQQYAPCRRWVFLRLLRSGKVVLLIDAYDELWKRQLPFDSEVQSFRKEYPRVACTLTSRTAYPTPTTFGKLVTLALPSAEELSAIRRRIAQ